MGVPYEADVYLWWVYEDHYDDCDDAYESERVFCLLWDVLN